MEVEVERLKSQVEVGVGGRNRSGTEGKLRMK